MPRLRVVLFDMDGTVLDTAPDMVNALTQLRREHGLPPVAFATARAAVSHGAARVVATGFRDADAEHFTALQQRFLEIYRGALSVDTVFFPGMEAVLDELSARGIGSGIVTNKAGWLTEPLLEQLGVRQRFVCVVSGDTLAQRKPHPAPLLHAAQLAGATAAECIYVGDAERDVQAAHAAGMLAVVANYGYLREDEDASTWGGDGYIGQPAQLLEWLYERGLA